MIKEVYNSNNIPLKIYQQITVARIVYVHRVDDLMYVVFKTNVGFYVSQQEAR